ncbi:hypothetical protein AGMMS49957_00310 [Synergistales bacterium]|nr:hypothetical protein AGMMS49957_00310 [Synergistales bacterium]
MTKADVGNVQVDLFLTEKEDAGNYRYRWRFYNAGGVTESNVGIPSWGEKSDALKIGQEEEYEVEFGAGYYLPNNRVSPIIIADKSVVSVGQYLSFDYNTVKGVNVLKFTLKGLKNGITTISLLYQDNNGTYYTTAPVSLKVSNGSSSGGGCSAGFGSGDNERHRSEPNRPRRGRSILAGAYRLSR